MTCLKIVTYSRIINGKPGKPFAAKKGLRQGDPMSPFMFVIVMEYLSRLLKKKIRNPAFKFHPKCAKTKIIQLGFDDNLLLFCKGDKTSINLLFGCFMEFSKASGLTANLAKNCVYFGGVSAILQQQILEMLGFSKGELPFRYLGVSLSSKRLSITQCQPLLDKILGRITTWTTKFLSYAGRVQLIKSVLFSIQTFWSQVFALPKKITNQITAICRRFLWTEDK